MQVSEFFIDVCVGALSAIPRWRFSRALEVKVLEGAAPRLENALVSYYEPPCEISRGRNDLTEHIVNREPEAGEIMLVLFGSLLCALSYTYPIKRLGLRVGIPGEILSPDRTRRS